MKQEEKENQVEIKKAIGKLYSVQEPKLINQVPVIKFELETKGGSIIEFVIWNSPEMLSPFTFDQDLIIYYKSKVKQGSKYSFVTNFCESIIDAQTAKKASAKDQSLTKLSSDKLQPRESSNAKWKKIYDDSLGENKDAITNWYKSLCSIHNCNLDFYHFYAQILVFKQDYGREKLNENYRLIRNFKGDRLTINHENIENLFFNLEYQNKMLKIYSKFV